MQLQRQREGE